jgi:tRNA threonylcarbamoyladenosine biosynthesis protein TsaB
MTNRTDPVGKARPIESKVGPILAIETGSRACSVAIVNGGVAVAEAHVATDHGQSTLLMPMIERVRAEAGCDYAELGRIAVAVGPGSFTGLRVGLAAALGISLASGVPAVGISSFLAVGIGILQAPEARHRRGFILLDSRREEPFLVEIGDDDTFKFPPRVTTVADFDALLASAGPAVVFGDAPTLARDAGAFPPDVFVIQRAPQVVLVAARAADPEHRYDLPPKPVYIRPPDVTMPKQP